MRLFGPCPPTPFLQAIADLAAYLPRYGQHKAAFPDHPRASPQRARRLLDRWGRPDRQMALIRVIGTKGKGSTAAMLEAVLRAAGYRTGLYTSPHLHSPRERLQVLGEPISRPAFVSALVRLRPLLEESLSWVDLGPATLFEGLTAAAMAHFARQGVEIAVVESGMGGRSDATQALAARLLLLTPFALDHQAYLGSTLEAIAAEKAGAIPPDAPVVCAPQPREAWEEIERRCREVGATLRRADAAAGLALGLAGCHQAVNAGVVLAAVQALREQGWRLPAWAVQEGLGSVTWPGRLEVVAGQPLTVADGAHNPAAAAALAETLEGRWGQERLRGGARRIVLLGCSQDKDLAGIVAALAPVATGAVVAQAHHHRAAEPEELAALWRAAGRAVEVIPEVSRALWRARAWAGPEGLVCACGSFFLVAEVREALGLAVREPWPEPAGQGASQQTGRPARQEDAGALGNSR